MRREFIKGGLIMLAGAAALAPGLGQAAGPKDSKRPGGGTPMPPLTIYHLEGRRSERAVWLMEELDFPYKLIFKPGDLEGSMDFIRKISPIVPMAPTVQYGPDVLVESGAILEIILNRHAPGRLQPGLMSHDYERHMIFMHYAEGSLASRLFSDYRAFLIQPPTARTSMVDSAAAVQFAEEHLKTHPWFGGAEFSSADIMMKFPLDVSTDLNLIDAAQFPLVAAWKKAIEARPAYKRMRAKALPNGPVGMLRPLAKRAEGPRTASKYARPDK
jgi:glutathione S-transferase